MAAVNVFGSQGVFLGTLAMPAFAMPAAAIAIRRTAILVALLSLAALPASAQGFKWWQDEDFRRELALTPDQSTHLEELFQKSLPTLRAQMEALDKAQKDFDRLVERADDAAVLQQVNILEGSRAELNKARITMLLRMRRSLTADQWAKFTALQEQRRRNRDGSQRGGSPGRNR